MNLTKYALKWEVANADCSTVTTNSCGTLFPAAPSMLLHGIGINAYPSNIKPLAEQPIA